MSGTTASFEKLSLPHLDAAYNLARMLMRHPEDAEDVVQEAYLKALRAFHGFRGNDVKPWLLTIVRNTAYTSLRDLRRRTGAFEYDAEVHRSFEPGPEAQSLNSERARGVERCIEALPVDFREVVVLREMEELSYRQISQITGVPAGTVMSRLSRARARLTECLKNSGALFREGVRP